MPAHLRTRKPFLFMRKMKYSIFCNFCVVTDSLDTNFTQVIEWFLQHNCTVYMHPLACSSPAKTSDWLYCWNLSHFGCPETATWPSLLHTLKINKILPQRQCPEPEPAHFGRSRGRPKRFLRAGAGIGTGPFCPGPEPKPEPPTIRHAPHPCFT